MPETEWEKEDKSTKPILKSEYDLKTFLIEVSSNKINFQDLLSLVTKELDTSFINEQETKLFYQFLFENILEWTDMGLTDLAKLRLSKLFAELKLEKSVGGFERILQGSNLTGSVIAVLPKSSRLFLEKLLPKKEEKPELSLER